VAVADFNSDGKGGTGFLRGGSYHGVALFHDEAGGAGAGIRRRFEPGRNGQRVARRYGKDGPGQTDIVAAGAWDAWLNGSEASKGLELVADGAIKNS
jgi:hypothetical protein